MSEKKISQLERVVEILDKKAQKCQDLFETTGKEAYLHKKRQFEKKISKTLEKLRRL